MACSVRETITRELKNNNFIDDKNNIIGSTQDVFPYIDSINQFAKDNFGVTDDVLITKSMSNVAGARVKIRFNTNIVEQIDTNRENNDFNSRQGVEEVFQENPELSSIGTEQQYSQYLDTIFPDSKVKDIVYHGTPVRFENDSFKIEYQGKNTNRTTKGFYFTDNKKLAEDYATSSVDYESFDSAEDYEARRTDIVYPVILDIKNLQLTNNIQDTESNKEKFKNADGFKTDEAFDDSMLQRGTIGHQYVVTNPEQIHILGSKQDIKGFKDFVNNNNFNSRQEVNEDILLNKSDESLFGNEEVNIPLGDNYGEFVKYKTVQYNNVDNEIRSINSKLASTVNKEPLLERRRTLQKDLKVLTEQLEKLQENKVQYMFQAIQEDLDNISNALQGDSTIADVKDVEARLNFYDAFLWGKDDEFTAGSLSEYVELTPEFNNLVAQAQDLSNKYPEFLIQKIKQLVSEDVIVQETIKNTGLDLDALLSSEKDITKFDSELMGVMGNAFSKDNILPQYLQILMHRTQIRHANTANELVANLNEVEKRTGLYNPDWIFNEDSEGQKDGFIKDLYTDDWFKALKNYRALKAIYTGNRNKDTHKAVLDWIRNNTTVVDFTKIPAIRELYASNSKYSSYFTSMTQVESEAWEKDMISKYGPKYDSLVQNIIQKLEAYEQMSINAEQTDTWINSFNIWEFIKNMKEGKKNSHFIPLDDKTTAYFSDFDAIPFLPLDSIKNQQNIFGENVPDTVYINEDFRRDIIGNSDNLEYYNAIKAISQYVNDTYHTNLTGKLSYPRVRKTWLESTHETLKDIKGGKFKAVGDLASNTLHYWKGLAYERGSYSQDNSDVHSNYTDSFNAEVRDLAQLYEIQGMTEGEAFTRAKQELIEDYSSDLSRDLKAVSQMAALHNAREEVGPVAKATLNMYKNMTDANGKERKNAISKLEYYVDHIIFNNINKYRNSGKFEGKSWNPGLKDFLGALDGITGGKVNTKSANFLSEGEQKIFEGFKEVLESGKIPESISLNELGFRLSKRQVTDVEGNTFTIFEVQGEKTTEEDFNTKFKAYLEAKIESLGLDLNLAGAIDGGLKTIILKSLALAPIPGIFNRIEGLNSGYIMDATGKYWSVGNMDIAKNMMSFWNTRRLPVKMLQNLGKSNNVTQMRIFEELTKRMPGVLQDRKDELQRNANENKFSLEDVDVFVLAVGNPERKNQGGIMLSMMMDFMIKDSQGNEMPLLDKNTQTFNGFEIVDGILKTKPGFEHLQDMFNFEDLIINMSVAISRSQGNYSGNDIMMAKRSIWGKAATMFLTWLPEHLNQRFGSSSQVDLYRRDVNPQGRYVSAFKANKINTATLFAAGGLGISYGMLGMAGLVGGGIISAIVFKKYLSKYMHADKAGIKRDVNHIQEFIQMLLSVGIEFMNYPSYLLSTIPGMSKLKIKNRAFENTTMTEEQRNSMRAMTRELAIMLSWLSVKMMVMALYNGIGGGDDDEKSPRRMRYYFLQNQISRSITTLSGFMNPYAFAKDQSRNAFLSHLTDTFKLVHSVTTFDWQGIKNNATAPTPIPLSIDRTIRNLVGNRENSILQDKIDYASQVDFNKIPAPLRWTTITAKDLFTDGEYSAKKEYNDARKEIREEIKKQVIEEYDEDKEVVKKITDLRMRKKVGSKYKDLSYEDASDIIEEGGVIQDPTKKATQTDRNAFKDKLKEQGLSNSEIADIMREEFRGK